MARPEVFIHENSRTMSNGYILAGLWTEHILLKTHIWNAAISSVCHRSTDFNWCHRCTVCQVHVLKLLYFFHFTVFSFYFRQYYSYVTDTQCKRVGTQCWVYGAIMFTEAILCIKNGKELFERTQALNIIIWLMLQLIVSVLCVVGCVMWHWYFQVIILNKKFNIDSISNGS